MKISIQQPEYFPWLGYFDKIRQVEKVIFLDNVQFKKRYFENRNKIRTYQGWTWLVTPVKTKGKYTQNIMDVETDNTQAWQKTLAASIMHNYKKAPYWKDLGDELCELVQIPYTRLVDLNLGIILLMMKKLGLERPWLLASTLGTTMHGSDLILEICEKVGASEYLSGKDGKNYMELGPFTAKNVTVHFQDFTHPAYTQVHGDFMPAMSTIDLYFNHGPQSLDIISHKAG